MTLTLGHAFLFHPNASKTRRPSLIRACFHFHRGLPRVDDALTGPQAKLKRPVKPAFLIWLRAKDSNLDRQVQSLLSYH